MLSPSSNCKLVSFVLGKAFWGRREKNLNEEPEFGNRILDDAHRLSNALQNIDLTGRFSVGQAMIETAIKSANTDMVLCLKKKMLRKKKVNNWHAKKRTCSKKEKGWRLTDLQLEKPWTVTVLVYSSILLFWWWWEARGRDR